MLGLSRTEMDTWPLAQLGAGQDGSAILASLVGGKAHQTMSYGPLSGQRCHS